MLCLYLQLWTYNQFLLPHLILSTCLTHVSGDLNSGKNWMDMDVMFKGSKERWIPLLDLLYKIWHKPMQNRLWMISDMLFTSKYTCNRILVLYPKLRLYVEGFASREFSHSHAYHIAHRSWPFFFTILWYERAASHQVWQSPMFPYISFNQM